MKKLYKHFYWAIPFILLFPLRKYGYVTEGLLGYLFGIAIDRYLFDYLQDNDKEV